MPRLLTDDAAKEKMQQIQDRLNTDPARNVAVVIPKATSATEELLNKDAISSLEDAAWVSTFQAGMDMGDATTKEQPSAAAAAADIQKDVIDLKAGDSGLQESVQKDSGLCCGGRLCSVQLVFNRNSRAWLTHVFFVLCAIPAGPFASITFPTPYHCLPLQEKEIQMELKKVGTRGTGLPHINEIVLKFY